MSTVLLTPRSAAQATPRGLFDVHEYARQRAFFTTHGLARRRSSTCPGWRRALGVGALWLKDETSRFGLPAFKSVGRRVRGARAWAPRGELAGVTTLVCASDGNHGRAVARAARSAGLAATIFLDGDVAAARVAAIASEGARVVRVDGTYDDAVREAAAHAARHRRPASSRTRRGTATSESRATSCSATRG